MSVRDIGGPILNLLNFLQVLLHLDESNEMFRINISHIHINATNIRMTYHYNNRYCIVPTSSYLSVVLNEGAVSVLEQTIVCRS